MFGDDKKKDKKSLKKKKSADKKKGSNLKVDDNAINDNSNVQNASAIDKTDTISQDSKPEEEEETGGTDPLVEKTIDPQRSSDGGNTENEESSPQSKSFSSANISDDDFRQ